MVISKFCDRCGEHIPDEYSLSRVQRTYTIQHKDIDDLCNTCYRKIIKFIESKE